MVYRYRAPNQHIKTRGELWSRSRRAAWHLGDPVPRWIPWKEWHSTSRDDRAEWEAICWELIEASQEEHRAESWYRLRRGSVDVGGV